MEVYIAVYSLIKDNGMTDEVLDATALRVFTTKEAAEEYVRKFHGHESDGVEYVNQGRSMSETKKGDFCVKAWKSYRQDDGVRVEEIKVCNYPLDGNADPIDDLNEYTFK